MCFNFVSFSFLQKLVVSDLDFCFVLLNFDPNFRTNVVVVVDGFDSNRHFCHNHVVDDVVVRHRSMTNVNANQFVDVSICLRVDVEIDVLNLNRIQQDPMDVDDVVNDLTMNNDEIFFRLNSI